MTAYYISNAILCASLVLFLSVNLTPKFNPVLTYFIIFIPFTFFALSQNLLSFINPYLLVLGSYVVYFCGDLFLFKDSAKSKLIIFTLSLSPYFAVIALHIIFRLLGMEIIDKIYMYPVATVIVNTIPCIILALLTLLIKKRKKRVSISLNQVLPFVIVPTSQIVLLISTWMLFNNEYYIKSIGSSPEPTLTSFKTVAIIIISAVILCIIADLILFVLMKRVSQNNAMREELRFMEYKNQTNLDYYRSIEKNAFETRKIRHDLNNILQVIYGLEESGAPNGEAISSIIAAQLKSSIDSIKIEKFSENMLVNAIAANKAEVCREKKIDFNFDLRVPEKTNIKEIDLCKAFVNIIDNAINAASELAESERKIEISSFVDGDFLYIKSINPSPASNTKSEPRGGHGLGQKILTDIAESYGGKFITSNENGIYTALLTVQKQGD